MLRDVLVPGPGKPADLFGIYPNWANSPNLRKFVDKLPGLGAANKNGLGQYIPVATPDTVTYPGSDYYEIALRPYSERMHSDLLNPTRLLGYVQTNNGTNNLCGGVGQPACTAANNNVAPEPIHYLGPMIIAQKDRAVRIKFTNQLPTGAAGKLFLPVDMTIMGAGPGPNSGWDGTQKADVICASAPNAPTPPACFTENRATIHLHGGKTPWISDGTPHQWITPAGEITQYTKGLSVFNVPDMPDPGPGSQTFYLTNQQSARMMFYHDHASGLTRLNVYAGEAAGYLIQDDTEKALIAQGIIPATQIPLIIQDKTFVDATPVTPDKVFPADLPPGVLATAVRPRIRWTDPLWNWGTGALDAAGVRTPVHGDLWWPHVYVPAPNPDDLSGVNPMGRWAYGPWFWPPTNNIRFGPVPNPYYDPACDPDVAPFYCEPRMMPGTPNTSWGAEAFLDTPVVNGTAFPYVEVNPTAYRFRILNASHDRFWNLQLYVADETGFKQLGYPTEVKMVPAAPTAGFPAKWPKDGRPGGAPDPALVGPSFIQIGSEGGFLPKPAVIPNQPVLWNNNPTTFNFGNVSDHALLLGPAERADVIIDFSQYAGKTLILYNDAPAAFPALDERLDYYTGIGDLRDSGGVEKVDPGFGPNTRTIMQIRVSGTLGVNGTPFNMTALTNAFIPPDGVTPGVFAAGQAPIIVGQKTYKNVYPANPTFPNTAPNWGYSQIFDNFLNFEDVPGKLQQIQMLPKAIHDEMGAAYDEYGRMSAKLGLEIPFTGNINQTFILQNYVDPPTENIADDTIQIWKITHNGVDTHPIHFHLFDVQLVNRVGWDAAIRIPDENEVGFKDTIRISPLEDTIVALRPRSPKLPFGIPDSIRPLNPALPIGATEGFNSLDTTTGQPLVTPTVNALYNYGWEYVWHCHILSHEEADMMRPIKLNMPRTLPGAPVLSTPGTVPPVLAWTDPTPPIPANLGNPANEIAFEIRRAPVNNGTTGQYTKIGMALANATSYTDSSASSAQAYSYVVLAVNAAGTSTSNAVTVTPSVPPPAGPAGLTATLLAGPQVRLQWTDQSTDETGFTVQRALDNAFLTGVQTFAGVVGPNISTYTDTTVAAGNTYFYRVIAVNTPAGVQSVPSNTASLLVPAAMAAPSNLSGTLLTGPFRVTLTWRDNSTGEQGFTIERSANGTFTDAVPQAVAANAVSATYPLASDVAGYFRVRAFDATATSPWSNVISPPLAPSNLGASQASPTVSVVLTWLDNSTNETTFTLERAVTVGGVAGTFAIISTRPVHSGTGAMTFTDATFTHGITYTYRVRANNSLGSSAYATSAAFVTQ